MLRYRIWLLIIISLAFNSCSNLINYYVRNLTDYTQIIILIPGERVKEVEGLTFQYSAEVLSIRYNTFEKLKSNLGSEMKNGSIAIKLPPKSTVYLGEGRIFEQEFKEVVFLKRESDTLSVKALNKVDAIEKTWQFPNRFALWYDFEK